MKFIFLLEYRQLEMLFVGVVVEEGVVHVDCFLVELVFDHKNQRDLLMNYHENFEGFQRHFVAVG